VDALSALTGLREATLGVILIVAAGCSPTGGPAAQAPAPEIARSTNCPAPTVSSWSTYSDPAYGFKVAYPPGFTFELQRAEIPGLLEFRRAVDKCYVNVSPPGQLEVTVYVKDSESLVAWVNKHTGGPASNSETDQYFSGVSHESPLRVAGRDALAFDWQPDAAPYTPHDTAMFISSAYVLVIGWWAEDAPGLPDATARSAYAAAMQADYKTMLANLRFG